MKFLLTGFEPFGGSPVNPSEQVVRALANETWAGLDLCTAILPVDRYRAPEQVFELMRKEKPDVIISLGEAAKRPAISVERVAINLMDYRIADNSGNVAEDIPVFENGPAAYFSTLPVRTLLKAFEEAQIPAELSFSAGAYLCNQIMYSVLHRLALHQVGAAAGFIHLPMLPEQASKLRPPAPSMSLETMVSAVRITLRPELYSH